MDAIRNILVPTDFSDFSSVALDYAISLSAQSNATIHLISVVEDDGIVTFRGPGANALREERKRAALTHPRTERNPFHG